MLDLETNGSNMAIGRGELLDTLEKMGLDAWTLVQIWDERLSDEW
jgi:hypothetical protein